MENSPSLPQQIQELKALLELQLQLTRELVCLCRHADLSASYAVDAVNALYSLVPQAK